MKIRPVGTELFDADGQTRRTLIVTFSHFFERAKKNSLGVTTKSNLIT